MGLKFHNQCNALTGLNSLVSGVNQFSVTCWMQLSAVPVFSHSFTKGTFFQSFFIHSVNDPGFIINANAASGANAQIRPAMAPGTNYFVMLTYDGSVNNIAKIYFNNPTPGISSFVTGPTAVSTAAINLGLDGAGTNADFIISQPAIYSTPMDTHYTDLLLGNLSPLDLGAIWYLPLDGPNGLTAVGTDTALQNHGTLGNASQYNLSSLNPSAFPGTITYAPNLAYTPPFQAIGYGDTGDRIVQKSNVVVFLMGNLAGNAVANLTSVNAAALPVFRVNGTPAPLASPTPFTWTDSDYSGPWCVFRLASHYGPTDVLDYTIPFGTFGTALGLSAPMLTPTVLPNYCGQDAPGFFGVTPFAPPTITMPMGMNLAQPNSVNYWGYTAPKNARYRCSGPTAYSGTTVVTYDQIVAGGDPTLPYSWTPGGAFFIFYWNTANNNGIEQSLPGQVGYPSPVGHHSYIFDDVNAGTTVTPGVGYLVVTLIWNPATVTATFVGRTVVGNTVTVTYDVQYVLDSNGNNHANGYNGALYWKFSGGVGKFYQDGTITNWWVFAPGDEDNDRSDPLAPSNTLRNLMTAPNGNGPATIRFVDSVGGNGGCNYQDPADLKQTSAFAWGGGGTPPIHVVGIRAFNTDVHKGPGPTGDGTYPFVSNRIYDRLLGFDGTDPTPGLGPYLDFSLNHNTGGAYVAGCSSQDNGDFMNGDAPGLTPQAASILEFVCDAPHKLRSGDLVVFPNSFGASAANAPITGGNETSLGTATVTSNSTTITFAIAPSPALVFNQGLLLDATSDPTRQSYKVTSGSGTTYQITPQFNGTTTSAATVQKTAIATFNNVSNPIWVTGTYTFIMVVNSTFGCTTGPKIQRYSQITPMIVSLAVTPASNAGSLSYAFAARLCATWPGCKPWIPLINYMQDACIQAIADEMAPILLPNTQVICELGDEHWNSPGWPTGVLAAIWGHLLSYLPGGTTVNGLWTCAASNPTSPSRTQAYCLQSAHQHAVLQARFDTYGKGIKVIGLYGSQYGNQAVTYNIINFAKTLGVAGVSGLQQLLPIGAVAHAPYSAAVNAFSGIPPDATFSNAFNPAIGNWGGPEMHCIYRLRQKYCQTLWSAWSNQFAALATYGGPPANGHVNGKPALYNYEAAVTTFDPNRNFILNHDCWYHPEMHYSVIAMLQSQQDGDFGVPGSGAQLSCLFTWGGIWGNGGAGSVPVFNHTVYGSQPIGTGANNLYTTTQVAKDYPQGVGNALCNDKQNQNPLVPALQIWWSGAPSIIIPPPPGQGYLDTEDGFHVLLEDASGSFAMETGVPAIPAGLGYLDTEDGFSFLLEDDSGALVTESVIAALVPLLPFINPRSVQGAPSAAQTVFGVNPFAVQ